MYTYAWLQSGMRCVVIKLFELIVFSSNIIYRLDNESRSALFNPWDANSPEKVISINEIINFPI